MITTRDTKAFSQFIMFFLLISPTCFFLCCHMITAAMMKKPMFIKMVTRIGTMKAQMKSVPGFKKHLKHIPLE